MTWSDQDWSGAVTGGGALSNKAAKADVDYGPAHGGDACAVCRHFSADSSGGNSGLCDEVAGPIDGRYWCRLFDRAG